MNLRGDIVTLLDLGKRLEIERGVDSLRRACVLVRLEGELLGLAVDEASEMIEAAQADRA